MTSRLTQRWRDAGRGTLLGVWLAVAGPAPAVVLCMVALCSEPAAAESVTAMFAKAQKALKDGKTKAAYKMLMVIVRRYPDHQPSHLLLGHILFRSGQIGPAYKHFKRISSDMVTADIAYEYGITMFQAKNCTKSIAGFSRVPASSKTIELAYFYRGVCHLRNRQYQKAQLYLNRAKHLPANLEASRREGLTIVRQQSRNERQGGAQPINPYLIVPTPPPPPVGYDPYAGVQPPPPDGGNATPDASGKPADATAAAAAKKPPPKPPPPVAGWTNAVTPSLTLTQAATNNDYFGYKNDHTDTSTTEIKLSSKAKYLASARASGGQPYFSLGLDLTKTNSKTSGNSTQFVAYQNDPGTVIQQDSQTPGTSVDKGDMLFNPEVSYPINGSSDITAGYKYAESYPGLKTDGKTGTHGPYANIDFGGDVATLKLTYTNTETVGADGKVSAINTTLGGDLNKTWDTTTGDLNYSHSVNSAPTGTPVTSVSPDAIAATLTKNWESSSLTLAVTNITNNPPAGYHPSDSSLSSNKAEISGNRTFDFGGTITLTASMTQFETYVTNVPDASATPATPPPGTPPPATPAAPATKPVTASGGQAQSALASFKLVPIDWIFGLASIKYTKTSYEFAGEVPPADQVLFEQKVSETTTVFTLQVGLTKTF